MAASSASVISSRLQRQFSPCSSKKSCQSSSKLCTSKLMGVPLKGCLLKKGKPVDISTKVSAVAVAAPTAEEIKEYVLPTWAEFELGKAPVFWKTMNGFAPTSGEKLTIFYSPTANKLAPNEKFGIAFNGGFNQPIMCGDEPRGMLKRVRGIADEPMFSIKIVIPKHAVSLIFSFTNGSDWDGPYKILFEVPKGWRNKPIEFFNEGLAKELTKEGACEKAIFPGSEIVISQCVMIGNLTVEGGDRCNLDLVSGCIDPSSPLFDPLANVDDGSCPIDSDSED